MNRRLSIYASAALILLIVAGLTVGNTPVVTRSTIGTNPEDYPIRPVPPDAPGFEPGINELDEILGDTIIVGFTYWERQHNGTTGRMIGLEPDNPDNGPTIHLSWTDLFAEAGERHVKFTRVWEEVDDIVIEETDGYLIDGGDRAGYVTLAMNSADGLAFPAYHSRIQPDDDYECRLAAENELFPGVFLEATIPGYLENTNLWPRAAWGEYIGTQYVHVVTSEQRLGNVDEMDICYSRSVYDPLENEVIPGDQLLVTEHGMNISADLAVSDNGNRVAIAQTVSRDYLYHPEEDPVQYNNDIWVWISEDGGATWDWDNPIDLTSFHLPQVEPEPANLDTFRTYVDCNVYFDHDDILHVAFTVSPFFFYEQGPNPARSTTINALIYHWDEESNVFTKAAEGLFWNFMSLGSWQKMIQRPSMYQDPVSGILWLVYHQFGEEGNLADKSDDDFANGEIFVTASPPTYGFYGRLWAEGVNITNSQWTIPGGAGAGDCRSETGPSIALNNDGDYLNINYILDLDAGFAANIPAEGDYTNNPVVWHRVMKQDLIDEFEANQSWLPNYPMHYDSLQHWEDPRNYDWEEHGGTFFVDELVLPQLDLQTETLDFGQVIIGGTDTMWVVVGNIGVDDLVLFSVDPGLEAFSPEMINNLTIAPGDVDSFYVEFIPTMEMDYEDVIIINTNDEYYGNEAVEVALSGTGVPIPVPYNLTGEIDYETSQATLSWESYGVELDEFVEFRLYRNDEQVWTGTDTFAVDLLTLVDPGLLVYEVSAYYDEGESDRSVFIELLWIPAPHDLAAELDQATGEVSLQWDYDFFDLDEFIEFHLYRNGEQVWAGQAVFCTDVLTGDETGEIVYEVSAFYDEGESELSDPATITWLPAPYDLSADLDPSTGDVNLAWNYDFFDLDEFIEFNLYRNGEQVWSGETVSYDDDLSSVESGSMVYEVSALHAEGESILSNQAEVLWLVPAYDLSAELDTLTGMVSLDWSYPEFGLDEFVEFRVYRDGEQQWAGEETFCEDDLSEEEPDTMYYRVSVYYDEGESALSDSVEIIWDGLSIILNHFTGIPTRWDVAAVYPNPFNPTVQVVVAVPQAAEVRMEIFDLLGRQVAQLAPGHLNPGYHRLSWTAEGPSGIYFVMVSNGNGWKELRKVMYLK